ncbi:hypothetical protein BCR42DRAFT_204905 [Absidia repens]|uniref:SH3 domain-containing protein n=1 Tax=Absidia repens TaxID=90262 RepID=A0A1X2IPS3_9FUNG|nr:hypothetical protein BCR42DRAFT_204905 [Absidia repens]
MIQTAMVKDSRRLTGYNSSHNINYNSNQVQQQHHHSLYDDDLDDQHQHHNHYYDDDDDEELDAEGHDEEEDEDDSASVLSIPDPNINFDLVYALHTFAATVDGQASVVKGDALTLLDDSNSYWWLVKVLKTSEVGYIPAENIETPYERLARLNSHRNIEVSIQK